MVDKDHLKSETITLDGNEDAPHNDLFLNEVSAASREQAPVQ